MEYLIIRNSELFGDIRLVDVDGEFHAVVADIKKALGAAGSISGFTNSCHNVLKMPIPTNGGPQLMNVIPAKEVERLIYTSRKAKAIDFEAWAEKELFPYMI